MDKSENEISELDLTLTETYLFSFHNDFDSGDRGFGHPRQCLEFVETYPSKIRDSIELGLY